MRDILTSPRAIEIQRRRRARRVRLSVLIFILFFCIVGALAYFSADRHITLNRTVVTGNRTINPEDIMTAVDKDLNGRYFFLFDKADTAIYPKSKIYRDLILAFPRIQTLSVYRDNLTTLHIAIIERSGTYLYCGSEVPVSNSDVGENCYFVDNNGYIFDTAPYFSGNVYFKYYSPLPGDATTSPLGKQVLTVDLFHTLTTFVDGLTSLGFKSDYIVLDPGGDYTLYLDNGSSTDPKILLRSDNDLPTILENLSLAMQKPEFASVIKQKYSTLQYIDLRFNNKVLYKFN